MRRFKVMGLVLVLMISLTVGSAVSSDTFLDRAKWGYTVATAQETFVDRGEWDYSVTGDSPLKVSPGTKGLGPLTRGAKYIHMIELKNSHTTDTLTAIFENWYDGQYIDVLMFKPGTDELKYEWVLPPNTTVGIRVEIRVKWDAPEGVDTIYFQPSHVVDLR